MNENALDRLNAISIDNQPNCTPEQELEASEMSTDDFLNGMSDMASRQISMFEEVTLESDNSNGSNDLVTENDQNESKIDQNVSISDQNNTQNASNNVFETVEYKELLSKFEALQLENKKLNDDVTQFANSVVDLNEKLDQAKNDYSDLKIKYDTAIDDCTKLNSEIENLKSSESNTNLSDELDQLKNENSILNNEKTNLLDENSKLKEKLEILTEKLKKRKKDGESLFNYNSNTQNAIYDQLAVNYLNLVKESNLRLDTFNDSAMSQLLDYICSKFM